MKANRWVLLLLISSLMLSSLLGIMIVKADFTVKNCPLPDCVLVGMTSSPQFWFLAPSSVQTDTQNPGSMRIRPGAVILFYNNDSSFHTTTSGTGHADPNSGKLFDSKLMAPNDVFVWQTPLQPQTVPYYCIPHELDGMVGTIVLSGQPIPEISSQHAILFIGTIVLGLLLLVRYRRISGITRN